MPLADNRGQSIFYEDAGGGRPVVLGHSFLCSGRMWRKQLPALAGHHRVLNLDLRGHGRSGDVMQGCSLYDAVADVVAVLDQEGIERAVWCGLSIGGMVALRAALTCPERVSGLILLDTDAGAETALRKLKYRAMGLGTRLLGMRPFLPPVARLMFGPTTFRDNAALVHEWNREFASVRLPSVLRVLDALLERDSVLPRLGEIRVPALVVVGEDDRSLPPPLSQRIHDGLPDSRLARIPAAGHLSVLEQPEPVTRAMLEFLGRLA